MDVQISEIEYFFQPESLVSLSGKYLSSYTYGLQIHKASSALICHSSHSIGWANQIQTSDSCWQSLVGLQVAFICLLESSTPFSPTAVSKCTYLIIMFLPDFSICLNSYHWILFQDCPLLWLMATESHLCWCLLVSVLNMRSGMLFEVLTVIEGLYAFLCAGSF